MAWCERWNPPTPKWTMPTVTFERSYDGTATVAGSVETLEELSCIAEDTFALFTDERIDNINRYEIQPDSVPLVDEAFRALH